MRSTQAVAVKKRSAKGATEIMGFLQQLSRDAADGYAGHVLDAAVAGPVECLGVDRSVLLTRSAIDNSWTPVCSRNFPHESLEHCSQPAESCILHKTVTTQSPVVVDDASPHAFPSACRLAPEDQTCLACIPVITPTGPPSVLAYTRSDGDSFAVWEIEFLNTLANLVATVLSTNSADPVVGTHIHSLTRLSDIVSSDCDMNEWLDQLLAHILAMLHADSGSVMLTEDGGLRVAASRALTLSADEGVRRAKDGSVSGRVITTRRPLALHGQVGGKQFQDAPPRPDIASSMSIPLIHKRRLFGVLNVNRGAMRRLFSDADVSEALPIAQHLAVGIDNARLYEAARAQARHFGNLYQIARSISSSLELESVLKMIVKRLKNLVPHDVFALLLCELETGRSQLVSGRGIPHGEDEDYAAMITPVAKLCSTAHRSVVIRDMAAHPHEEIRQVAAQRDVHSAIVVALVVKRRIVGYLAAYRHAPGAFPRHVTGLLLGLAQLAAIAIENARLYERQSGLAHIARKELVAPSLESIPGYDVGGRYAPAHEVGGDYYDVIKIDHWRYGLVVADVAGKDVTAALHISMCRHALRALAEHISSPAKLMQKMNRFIYDHTDPEGFISMFYGLLDTSKGMLTYSSAGHEPGLLLRRRTNSFRTLATRGMILGIAPDATFAEGLSSIQPGDVLLLYTDGLLEALSDDQTSGTGALERLLLDNSSESAQAIADAIHLAALSRHTGRSPDDIAILVVKRD